MNEFENEKRVSFGEIMANIFNIAVTEGDTHNVIIPENILRKIPDGKTLRITADKPNGISITMEKTFKGEGMLIGKDGVLHIVTDSNKNEIFTLEDDSFLEISSNGEVRIKLQNLNV